MQLKRLEAYGFKSFADKIEIEFNKGITGIVGPNGSGKSNITDAIRWVLGEQNIRNLRGTKAEDVIFNGSTSRRALGVAEVSLILSNDGELPVDFHEVVVTRRLFRSGESEFYINRSHCRLKDICNLFADTGLGQDGMSVIRQNKIDEILNSKPEERRLFFEEAAGITKYRNRKRESVRKLENTEKNLVRVTDILQEIKNQLAPLAEHAEKTRQYEALQTEQRTCQLTELYYQEEDLAGQEAKSQQDYQAGKDEVLSAETALHLAESKKETLQKELLEVEKSLQALMEKNNALRTRLAESSNEVARLEERQRQRGLEQERIFSQRQELEANLSEAKEQAETLQENVQQAEDRFAVQTALLAGKRKEAELLQTQLQTQKKALQELLREKEEKQQQLFSKENELLLLERELSVGAENQKNQQGSLEEVQKALQEGKTACTAITQKIQQAQKEREAQEKTCASLLQEAEKNQQQERTLQEKVQQARQTLETTKQQIVFLQHMQESYEGFGRAAKAVLTSHDPWQSGVCGAVAELFQVPKEYLAAMEVALGSSLQNIVTKDEETAKRAIAFLKQNHKGRVTFLPLSSLVVREPKEKHLEEERGVVGYANKLLQTEAAYQRAADFLLARTVVVDTLDHALALAKKYQYRLRIVTLEGELLSPGGSLSGGSRQRQEASFLSRSSELEVLAAKQQEAAAHLEALLAEWKQAAHAVKDLEEKVQIVQTALQEQAVQLAAEEMQQHHLQEQCSEKEAAVQQYQQLAAEFQQNFSRMQNEKNRQSHALSSLKADFAQLEECVQKAQEAFEDAQQDGADLEKYLQKQSLEHAVLEQEIAHIQTLRREKEQWYAQLERRLAENQQAETRLFSGIEQEDQHLADLKAQQQQWNRQQVSGQAEQDALYEQKMGKLVAGQKNDKTAKDLARRLNHLQTKLHEIELKTAQITFQREQCQALMMQEYGKTPESAKEMVLPISLTKLKEKLQEISMAMEALGPVNPNAVHEYEELQKRHDFMQQQADDLVSAKENLQSILRDMDVTMTRQFREAFARINQFFGEIFIQLFGGGKAELLLTDSQEVLSSGVEIVVQLPEKKRQNLTALSGGERALTVIALLFAFLHYKPAPFSVLDEIDAPLDEANIVRFCQFLRDYSLQTQFILVTHRKSTMEATDVMYGVTMEDAGVSKILSVHLNEAENE